MLLARNIAPAAYPFVCLLHPFMNGELEVVAKDGDRLRPAAAAEAGDGQFKQAQAQAASLKEPVRQLPGATAITAGWGDNLIAVNRFAPSTVSVKVGDTVTWTDESPYMPHTITFESPFQTPEDPNSFLPAGAKSGSRYSGGVAHSGLIGPAPEFPTTSFSLRFAKAGRYGYVCILHPGMAGVVEVK
ncbi:MAG: cupredoxin domain-containing protein [Actinomycetota bacterium]